MIVTNLSVMFAGFYCFIGAVVFLIVFNLVGYIYLRLFMSFLHPGGTEDNNKNDINIEKL